MRGRSYINFMQRIKLVKTGKKNTPTWRIVVVEKTRTGKGSVSDYIGHYHPHLKPKSFVIDMEKFKFWKEKGAQPTETVTRLIGRFIEKNKDYQKIVKTKIYKSKKPEDPSSHEATKGTEKEAVAPVVAPSESAEVPATEEVAEETPATEAPTEETKEEVAKEEKVGSDKNENEG